ncbi:FAD binding domain-containing protein [Colletotrichum salicis]|uniref:FAD binding domain-containing protein n=1 Tax=Colletotrichum salicis TaxID=1209931 RepID=A0A135UJE7_9PEZI|nr:FAD binding domain-containing protein [Colletotrichum salicis]
MVSHDPFVIVVGAGPSGLLLSLLLARNNVPVTLVEKTKTLDKQPRATHYAGPAVEFLHRAGVMEDVSRQGFYPNKLTYRTFENKVLGTLDHTVLPEDPNRLVCLPLDQLGHILLSHLEKQPSAEILWDYEVVEIRDDNGLGIITAKTSSGTKELRAKYVVGCDGANSIIRRKIFGDWVFPGKTWDTQVVATNVYYDFHKFGYEDANFIVDPEHWYMASKISKDGAWRVSYGVSAALTKEELLSEQEEKWRNMLPGNPSPQDYRIVNFSPYKVHQRLAESMRVGPFVLAADAAHLCNPFGGLGLTGGIVDVGGLVDCLVGIQKGKADDSILDIYSQVRREKYLQFIDPVSSSNLVRMYDSDPRSLAERDEFVKAMNAAGNDPVKTKALVDGINAIAYDFTKHFNVDGVPEL